MITKIGRFAVPAVILAYWGFVLRHVAPSVTAGDSGEFITAAWTLSLPHAPSYPLYSLAGKAFSLLAPIGNAAYRINLFSAAANLVSVCFVFLISRTLGLSRTASLFAALLLGASPAFFHNGLVAEVFALNTLFALAVYWAALSPVRASLSLSGLLAGLGMGNHQTLSLVLPGVAALFRSDETRRLPRLLPSAALLFILGVGIYFYLPFRSRREPPLDWGNPETVSKLYRTISRKDYGALTLSLGETPSRSFSNTLEQVSRFLRHFTYELTVIGLVLVLGGIFLFWREQIRLALGLILAWFLSGPFFFVLGNLGFDAQSNGVLERFIILPVAFAVLASGRTVDVLRRRSAVLVWPLFLLPAFLFHRSSHAFPLRSDFLVHDYSRGILRTMPLGSAFFMDGGDDTFFSMAFQRFVQRRRQDLSVFDRGGLIFTNPYGPDFRSLAREEKERRRQTVEGGWFSRAPLFYSTMNEKILPGLRLNPKGFLYKAEPPLVPERRDSGLRQWEFYSLRSLPPDNQDYRTLALAPYFPFMKARCLWNAGFWDEAVSHLMRAWQMAPQVPWLKGNLVAQSLDFAFDRMRAEDWTRAKRLYDLCLTVDPGRSDAMTNLGVLSEKTGDWSASAQWYERALKVDSRNVNALYNLAVIYWRQGDWPRVISTLETVTELDPSHLGARKYLELARRRQTGGS